MKHFLILLCSSMMILSCHGTQGLSDGSVDRISTGHHGQDLGRTELIHFLRDKPGLQIVNRGGSYDVVVRGVRSFTGENTPLYTLDGVAIGRDYDSVARTVDATQIVSVKVITPANAGIFGSRGQNGVIAIKTKS